VRGLVECVTTRIKIGRPHPLRPHQVAAMRRPGRSCRRRSSR
jgi:hypothetical protein